MSTAVASIAASATPADLAAAAVQPQVPATPSVPGGWAFVAYQLRALQALVGYSLTPGHPEFNAQAVDELAQQLYANGIDDMRSLGFHVEHGTTLHSVCYAGSGESGGGVCIDEPATFDNCWFVNRRTGARLPNAAAVMGGCVVSEGYGEAGTGGGFTCPACPHEGDVVDLGNFGSSFAGRWSLRYVVQFVGGFAGGQAVPVGILHQSASDWAQLRHGLLFLVGAVAMVVPGLNVAVGSLVFGAEFAAAYPAVVSLATNAAFNATLGGQDIEHAVGGALASYAGASAGGVAGAQFDSGLVARTVGAATTAALTGRDIQQAVGMAALQYTAATQPARVVAPPSQGVDMSNGDGFSLPAGDTGTQDYLYGGQIVDLGEGFAALSLTPDEAAGLGADPGTVFDTSGMDHGFVGPPEPSTPTLPANVPPASPSDGAGSGFDWGDALSNITTFALKAYQTYQQGRGATGVPVRAPGPAQVVNPNGTITTRNPNGTVTSGRPPVGQAVAAADGTLYVNNGNGTYTRIRADGSSETLPYSAAAAGGVVPGFFSDNTHVLLVGGLVLGGLYVLTAGRR